MSDPNPTTEMAYWLSDNLADWLELSHSQCQHKEFILRCIMPHISSYGINAMYEFVKGDYDDGDLIDPKM